MDQTRRHVLLGAASVLGAAALIGVKPSGAAALEVGERAPDFTLPATTGADIKLSQFRGKPVLIEFYGADFSPV